MVFLIDLHVKLISLCVTRASQRMSQRKAKAHQYVTDQQSNTIH